MSWMEVTCEYEALCDQYSAIMCFIKLPCADGETEG